VLLNVTALFSFKKQRVEGRPIKARQNKKREKQEEIVLLSKTKVVTMAQQSLGELWTLRNTLFQDENMEPILEDQSEFILKFKVFKKGEYEFMLVSHCVVDEKNQKIKVICENEYDIGYFHSGEGFRNVLYEQRRLIDKEKDTQPIKNTSLCVENPIEETKVPTVTTTHSEHLPDIANISIS
jgi:hypothetical protein